MTELEKEIKMLRTFVLSQAFYADALEIGTPGRGGSIRVHGSFDMPKDFERKVNRAIEVLNRAREKMYGDALDRFKQTVTELEKQEKQGGEA